MKHRLVFVKLFAALMVAALAFSALSVHGTVAAPLAGFANGGFETGDWSGWTSPNDTVTPPTVFENWGLTGTAPFGWSSISRQVGGTNLSAIVAPGLDPRTDSHLNQVHFGNWAARLNSEMGSGMNANAMRQTFTVVAGDVQADGSIHVTFSYAPVMQDPGHPVEQQPYFFTGVKNLTTDTVLYETFFTANQPGFPWQLASTGWYYMDWQQVDVVSAPTNPVIAIGDQIEVEVIAAGCSQGGHAGYVYLDDLGTKPPAADGPTITLVTPISGPDTGGTVVTITGTHLDKVKALYIGGDSVLPAAFTTQTATTIVFTTPGDPAGLVNITLVSDVGPAVALKAFEYLADNPPNITAISVIHGPVTGGTIVVITGTNLAGEGRRVTFGDVEATCSSNAAGTQLTCTSPAHAAGPVNISISTKTGRDTFSSVFFTYDPVLPGTGFAPNRMTTLPAQTVSYADLGDLWLEIPALGVQMPIVGVPQANGTWDVSWLGDQAGWLDGSTFPTWAGNSVITGHVYDANGNPGPFAGLNRLWYGSQVIVHAWGGQYVYAVRSVMQVAPGDTAAMMKHQELPWLTLVTCRGYDEASNSYKYRVLVRAVLVEVK